MAVGGDGDGQRAMALCVAERGEDVRSRATGSDPNDGVVSRDVQLFEGAARVDAVVFRAFDGLGDGSMPTGDQRTDELRGGAEGGRALGSIEDSETAAGTGSHVDETATGLHPGNDAVDGTSDGRKLSRNGGRDSAILPIHEVDDLPGGHVVKISGGFVALFGTPAFRATARSMCRGHL